MPRPQAGTNLSTPQVSCHLSLQQSHGAFCPEVFINEDNELRVEHYRPSEMVLDP